MNTPSSHSGSHAGFWVVIILLGLGLAFSLLLNLGGLIGLCLFSRPHFIGQPEDEYPQLRETWSYGTGTAKVARIPVTGIIMRGGDGGFMGFSSEDMTESILRQIRKAQQDEAIQAIILEIDSPGGELTPTDEIYEALAQFRQSAPDRRIVTLVSGLAASGGYYIAMASDWIIMEPTALVGSIGVIMQTLNWKILSEKIGVRDVTIKAGKNKDLLNPFQDVPPEQQALLQKLVDDMYQRFVEIVQSQRGLNDEILPVVADGRVFTSADALSHDLVDQQGYWEEAVAKTSELLGGASLRIVRYREPPDFTRWLTEIRAPFQFNLSACLQAETPRLMYLWRP